MPSGTRAVAGDGPAPGPAGTTYEILRQRLAVLGEGLRERLEALDGKRREVFGSVEPKILQADRITTQHNCLPRDLIRVGPNRFLFGFNVHFGLKKEIELGDVFAVYERDEASGSFREGDLAPLADPRFLTDFKRLYHVYEKTVFSKFSEIEGRIYMVFRIGAGASDIAVFKWTVERGQLRYVDGRAESDYRRLGFPPPHQFRWVTPDRESYRYGDYPHVSIDDRVFVECLGGDLTIKVEDNTASGEGVYAEPVEDRHQKVDDAEIAYAVLDPLVILKIRPYKETLPRFFVFHQKLQTVHRIDSIGQSCALLPEEHGLVFPDGYYLATGEVKLFEARESGLVLERILHASTGEDSLYVFYDTQEGVYVLMAYRLIAQQVVERVVCHGFSLFPDGHLLLFRADSEPQKHHSIQLRQTPFYEKGHEPPGRRDAFLYQIGNKDVVRCLAETQEILSLAQRSRPYAELYADLVRRCGVVLDAYPWLSHAEALGLDEALRGVRDAASRAVDEFDKVRRLQREAVQQVAALRKRCDEQFGALRRASFHHLDDHVRHLAQLRRLRGELISLREVRYVDASALDELEKVLIARTDELSAACVRFLLGPEALEPYRKRAAEHLAAVDRVTRVVEGKKLDEAAAEARTELEMLVEIVNNLRIDDATESTRILDGITAIYSTLNQVRAALQKKLESLGTVENSARFAAQLKLLGQSAASSLDLCDTPAKCDEALNRLAVQIEELEGAFADFEDCTVRLAERRTELYEAFEQRKLALIEQRNRRAGALSAAGDRILKVIQNRLAGFATVQEINTYLASDLMVAKVRDQIAELLAMGDSVKADDLQGRLKSAQQEAVRQLKDREELFQGGPGVIQLGRHRFNVTTQPLDLTLVHRDGQPFLHLTGTRYFEAITDPAFLATRSAWNQEFPSENSDVYRAEFLAARLLERIPDAPPVRGATLVEASAEPGDSTTPQSAPLTVDVVMGFSEERRLAWVQEAMAPRLQEGYLKGVHDHDAAAIFEVLLATHVGLGLARFPPDARACATVHWHRFCPSETRALWEVRLRAFGERNRLFPGDVIQRDYCRSLETLIAAWARETGLYSPELAAPAGEYLFHELTHGGPFVSSREADQLAAAFRHHLVTKGSDGSFARSRGELETHPVSDLQLVRDWVRGFLLGLPGASLRYLEETAAIVFCGTGLVRSVLEAPTSRVLESLKGSHPRIRGNVYAFDYLDFRERLGRFDRETVPRFEEYRRHRQRLLEEERARLRLDEFRPRVLTSFVRNELIDEVYLPLIGDNLAKQIGAAGDQKRTDLMGLLLVVSPPGYGKTTLLEYIANRLGIVFIKINGPALGHAVTSLDPEDAPNAGARDEIQKLNLAFEMGDNAMICIDDIQHCNPEFLQKFISLCDGQRKIEGVWRGRSRTYDLRGRRMVVVMAGNPYTESGQKFRIPDMLANRADTYNLGDVLGNRVDAFKGSYIENAATSNPILATVAVRHPKDVRTFIRRAQSSAVGAMGTAAPAGEGEGADWEGTYSSQEIEEVLAVTRRLLAVREVVLRVNQEYIASAGQADEFRTEPAFRLQGSYRNMNRLAERIAPIMNDDEIRALLVDHYRNEAQTLTTGSEANLLKFKELMGWLGPEEQTRWDEIRRTFRRNQLVRGSGDSNDPVGRVVGQMAAFHAGLEGIQRTLQTGLERDERGRHAAEAPGTEAPPKPVPVDWSPLVQSLEQLRAVLAERPPVVPQPSASEPRVATADTILAERLTAGLAALREDLSRAVAVTHSTAMAERVDSLSHELEMIHSTLATLKDLAGQQRDHLRAAQDLLAARARQGTVEFEVTQDMLTNERAFLEHFHQVLAKTERIPGDARPPEDPPSPPKLNPDF
ncbi:MAG: DNA repair ATPase [Limisphaerales bacterium]